MHNRKVQVRKGRQDVIHGQMSLEWCPEGRESPAYTKSWSGQETIPRNLPKGLAMKWTLAVINIDMCQELTSTLCMSSLNANNIVRKQVLLLSPRYRRGSWGTARLRCLLNISCEARVQSERLTPEPLLSNTCFLSTKCTVCAEVLRGAKAGVVALNWGQTFWIGEQKSVCVSISLGIFPLRSGRTEYFQRNQSAPISKSPRGLG